MWAAAVSLLVLCPAGVALRLQPGPRAEARGAWAARLRSRARGQQAAGGAPVRKGGLRCRAPPPACGAGLAPSAGVVVSAFEEDLSWLAEVDVGGNITVYVHDRNRKRTHYGDSPADNLRAARKSQEFLESTNSARTRPIVFIDIPNAGDEAAAFLGHIIKHYDVLPEVLFFVHGHRCAKHESFDMARLLENRWHCFHPSTGYETLNNPYNQHVCPTMNSSRWANEKRVVKMRIPWSELMEEELGTFPQDFCFDSYAQFVVSRERIRSHPLDFYRKLLDGVMKGKTSMEWYWRMVFVPRFL